MRETNTHVYFYTGFLGNWYPAKFKLDGLDFNNTEQAFMYLKARFFNDDLSAVNIWKAKNARESKDLGRLVKNYNDKEWSCVRVGFMIYANYLKFSQNSELREWLLNTGNKTLVEASPIDNIWGVGLGEDNNLILNETNWNGQNLLGKALMEVRKLIK